MDFKIGITSEDYERLAAFVKFRNARHPEQAMSVSDMGTLLFHHIINLSYVISDVSNSDFGVVGHVEDYEFNGDFDNEDWDDDGDGGDDDLGRAIIV